MIVVKKSYRRYKKSKLVTFATNLNTNLLANVATYPSPPISSATMLAAIANYERLTELAFVERTDHNTEMAGKSKSSLITLLDEQIEYIEGIAPDAASLIGLGLEPVVNGSTKAPLPGQATGVKASDSLYPNSVIVSCNPVKISGTGKVTYYVYETNEAGSLEKALLCSGGNSRKLEFGGLETGKVYYFYVKAKTTAGFGPPSAPVRWVGR